MGGPNGTQPPTARQVSGSQRAKVLQLFLILLIGRYTSWSAESDSNTRVKSTGLPFERKYFECQGVIFRLAPSLEILADQIPDFLWLAATVRFIGSQPELGASLS